MKKLTIAFLISLSLTLFAAVKGEKNISKPIVKYDARYTIIHSNKKVVMLFDTATGILNTALISKTGLSAWRVYDVNKIAKKYGKEEIKPDKYFDNKDVHDRYKIKLISNKLVIVDTLTGRIWYCRHSNGVCDIWKVYDFRQE